MHVMEHAEARGPWLCALTREGDKEPLRPQTMNKILDDCMVQAGPSEATTVHHIDGAILHISMVGHKDIEAPITPLMGTRRNKYGPVSL